MNSSLPKPPKPTTSVKAPMKMGSTAVKLPKAKKMAGPFAKPSLFFKSEITGIKKPSIEKLRVFLEHVHGHKK